MPGRFRRRLLGCLALSFGLAIGAAPGCGARWTPVHVQAAGIRLVPAMRHVSVGGSPHGAGYARGKVYVCDIRSDRVVVVDPQTGRTSDLKVGLAPGYTTVSDDERYVAVTNEGDGSVSLIDAAKVEVAANITGVGSNPDKLRFQPDGQGIFVGLGAESAIAHIDLTTPVPTVRRIAAGPASGGRWVALDGDTLVAPDNAGDSIDILDMPTERNRIVKVGPGPRAVAIASFRGRDGRQHRVVVASVGPAGSDQAVLLDLDSQAELARLPIGAGPFEALAVDAKVFITNNRAGTVSVVDADRRVVEATIPVGRQPAHLRLAPSGGGGPARQIWVGCDGERFCTVIDADTDRVYARVETQEGHHSMTFSTDGRYGFLTNFNSSSVSMIDRAQL